MSNDHLIEGDVIEERVRKAPPGIPILLGLIAFIGVIVWRFIVAIAAADAGTGSPWTIVFWVLMLVLDIVLMVGLFTIDPNEAKVLQLFGAYRGTVKDPGLRWANPFYTKEKVSLRVRNFETGKMKVTDARGNPIELAVVVVWKVVDTAEAVFMVDDFKHFVQVQSEAAARNMATQYVYDAHEEGEISLVSHVVEISDKLEGEIQERLANAGIHIIEARISHLAYSPEIAAAMLRRQQAAAVVAARREIVEGAVGMVEMALDKLAEKQIIELDEERKATMVSNLLVVLCSEHETQPVVNTGSLYQ